MKTRDFSVGCSVTIEPHDDVWLVSLKTDDPHTVTMQTHHELPDAIEAVHEWPLMLSDETEIREYPRATTRLLRETLARMALGEEVRLPKTVDEVVMRDQLRAWFERKTDPGKY
jgi:hypothetical protein